MNSDRFVHQDIDFFHKKTCKVLADKLGPWAVVAFLSLCTEAKRSRIPGTVIVTSEPAFWQLLGLHDRDLEFSMDDLLSLLGRQKQTSRRRVGVLSHVVLTNYGRWQNDAKREDARNRKARYRTGSKGDTKRTGAGQSAGQPRDRELEVESTLNPSSPNGTSPSPFGPLLEEKCAHCGSTPSRDDGRHVLCDSCRAPAEGAAA